MKAIPTTSVQTFWDIDISQLSFEESSDWIIERVFDKGTLEEVLSVVKY